MPAAVAGNRAAAEATAPPSVTAARAAAGTSRTAAPPSAASAPPPTTTSHARTSALTPGNGVTMTPATELTLSAPRSAGGAGPRCPRQRR